jgi:chlorobactene glucosyltransferase
MIPFLVGLLWSVAVAGLLIRAVRQYRAYETVQTVSDCLDSRAPGLTVIVPARNEEDNITRCLASLAKQRYATERLQILVVDDNSEDKTGELVRLFSRRHPNVRGIAAGPLPFNWAGKVHACWQGAGEARGEWLCFVDADTVAAPELLCSAVSLAEDRKVDMLSLHPFQKLLTFWERLIIPAGLFLAAFASNLRQVNDPEAPEATANGQFILIRRHVYDSVGGHAAVHDSLIEDSALAQLVKDAGYRLFVANAAPLFCVRMYNGLGELWEGLTKNAIHMAPSTAAGIVMAFLAFAIAWATLAVPLCIYSQWWLPAAPLVVYAGLAFSLAGSISLLGAHIATARYFRLPLWYGLLFPLGLTMAAALGVYSAWKQGTGSVVWKSRTYDG